MKNKKMYCNWTKKTSLMMEKTLFNKGREERNKGGMRVIQYIVVRWMNISFFFLRRTNETERLIYFV